MTPQTFARPTFARRLPEPRPIPLRLMSALGLLLLGAAPAAAMPGHSFCGAMGGMAMQQAEAATIQVTGSGMATVAPDLAVVTLGVTVQAPTAGEAMSQNATRQQAVIAALQDRGVEARDIQTSGLSLSPMQDYSREGQPPRITGYQAGNVVTVRVRDLQQMGATIDAIVAAGANEVQGISFQRNDPAETEAEARRRAVANARDRAEVIAAAAGQRLGRLIAISDTAQGAAPPEPMMMRAMAAGKDSTPVQAGELSVSAEVTARWELLPAGEMRQPGPGEVPPGGEMISPPPPIPMGQPPMGQMPMGGAPMGGAPMGHMPMGQGMPTPVPPAATGPAAEAAGKGLEPVVVPDPATAAPAGVTPPPTATPEATGATAKPAPAPDAGPAATMPAPDAAPASGAPAAPPAN